MTLATFTLTLALSAVHVQVPPVPAVPAQPVIPAVPAMPPAPFIAPDFEMLDIEMPDLAALPYIAEGAVQKAMIEAEAAMASLPALTSFSVDFAKLDRELASLGELTAALPFDRHKLEAELAAAHTAFEWSWQERSGERERAVYENARIALDRREWDTAATRFDQVAAMKGDRADAALYWKAYAQSRAGKTPEAQATITALRAAYPKSRYLNDANALEVELKRGGGQQISPASQQDEDLKLLAIQGLQDTDPEQAIPLLEKILASANGPRVKERALYVLALSNSPRAQEIMGRIAKGGSNPDLQRKAIDYIGMNSQPGSRSVLDEVYNTSPDVDIRRRVLRGYMSSGDKAKLLAIAQSEQNAELRIEAIRYLGSAGGGNELAQLYEKESSPEVRTQIVRSLGAAGAIDRLQHLVRTEKDPVVRTQVIRAFAMVDREKASPMLREMYGTETTVDGKRAILRALHAQDDADAIVAIARRETNQELKEFAVRQLSTMTKSKAALDYLMELLNK